MRPAVVNRGDDEVAIDGAPMGPQAAPCASSA
jgi:hypothetical protein